MKAHQLNWLKCICSTDLMFLPKLINCQDSEIQRVMQYFNRTLNFTLNVMNTRYYFWVINVFTDKLHLEVIWFIGLTC